MKNAIKIVSIIYIPLIALEMLLFLILGIAFLGIASDPGAYGDLGLSAEEASIVFSTYGITLIVMTLVLIPGLVFDIILLKKSTSPLESSKSSWITMGVLGVVFGANIPGILSIIYGAIKKDANPNAEEVHFKDKEDDSPKPSDYGSSDRF